MGLQATNAGIDFQQRISAFMMILMEFDIDISAVLQLNVNDKIEEINFEACECIDDLILKLDSGKKIYFQMKRTISMSESIDSEFYGVCEQFVKQYLKQNHKDVAYILATRTEASKAITVKLKRILDGIRLANKLQIFEYLNKEEITIFNKMQNNIKNLYKKFKTEDISDDELLELLSRIYIEIFDIETGEEFEKTVKLILYNRINVDVGLFWNTLISKAVEYGANRRLLSKQALKEQCKSYFEDRKNEKIEISEEFLKKTWKNGFRDISVQIDYVVAIPNNKTKKEMKIDKETVFVFELYRFDNSTKKDSLKYMSPNIMIWKNGLEYEVLFRCATQDRCYKYIENELSEKIGETHEIVVVPVNEHYEYTDVERLHENVLLKSIDKQKDCICINCGKAIFSNDSYLVEVDNEEISAVAGMVHKHCIRPVDRIIGEVIIPNIEDYSYLKSFDISLWAKLIKKGKQAWYNIKKMTLCKTSIVIDTDEVFSDGNYCLYYILENGDKKYLTNRGVIDRFSKEEAENLRNKYEKQLEQAKSERNPLGYSSESFIFGAYKQIMEQVGDKEEFVACLEINAELYNEFVAKMYNDCETYYAPVIYLSVEGKPFILPNGCFPMLSNPLELPKYIKNWEEMGFKITEYEVCIIKDDNEFILKMISLITNGVLPIVDCLFEFNGKIIRGIDIHLMWEFRDKFIDESKNIEVEQEADKN